jgi:peptidoglycan/LPS O-acetylase OafA/YrhL
VLRWTAMALAFTWVVDKARRGFGGAAGRLLNLGSLRYVGKISYGLYVYHFFTPALLAYLPGALGQGLLRPVSLAALSFALAVPSWHLMERPLLRLKRYVADERTPAEPVEPAARRAA